MEFDEKGEARRVLYTKETPTVRAGNRFTYFPPKIEFSYKAVLDNLADAIEAEGKNNNIEIVDKLETKEAEKLSYPELRAEATELWTKIVTGEDKEEKAKRVLKRAEMIFGHPIKLSEITEDQCDLYYLVILEMRDLYKELSK